ncbi:MAG: hypothetical protein AUI21_03550 [Nitrospirae bacterium 13_1_40CM_2_62_10]|nr:MAG: hypothetical protein AUI21_03550 [Nitrospirae bacterium 13_1_40CM_2_62_10]
MRLFRLETESEVVQLLQESHLWDDRASWKSYGDINNNRGIVGNQQSSPVAALVEKLVNSIDAVLTAECLKRGIDPAGPDAPQTMHEAVKEFLGVYDGRIETVTASQRTRLAERVRLIACGTREQPAYMILDQGEGQHPEDFPRTFLSLLRDNKTRIPFVQGKYNMGGTGVLQFAGTHSFQFILSKRQPDVPASNREVPSRGSWGFTLVRRMDPGPDQPQSTYVYLAPGGEIPSFEADSIQAGPGRYPELYVEEMIAGTCIKLWNYRFPGRLKTLATLDLRYALEEHLQDPALPVRIMERRPGYRAHYYDTTMSGLCAVLNDNRPDIEVGFDTGTPLEVPKVGRIHMRVVVLKEDPDKTAEEKHYPVGLFFNVNGQMHGALGKDFIMRRTKYDYIADSIIVMLDCTSLPTRTREDLFLASRDRMRQIDERSAIEDSVVAYLKDHAGLRELNARRRQARLAATLTEDAASSVIQDLVRSDPTLADLFGKGKRIKIPEGPPGPVEAYVGRKFPTYFRLAKNPPGGLVKICSRNRTCKVDFETDASNDYFSRASEQGSLNAIGSAHALSTNLWNGRATLRVAPLDTSNVGDRLNVVVRVDDVSRSRPLESSFVLEVAEDEEERERPSGPETPPSGPLLKALPNIREVLRDQWAHVGFDETSAILLRSGEEDTLDVFINMDNIYLRNEKARRRDLSPDLMNYWFKYGVCLLAFGMLYRKREERRNQGNELEESPLGDFADEIAEACKGVAITVIPVIANLGLGKNRETAKS